MDFVWKFSFLTVAVLVLCSVSVESEREPSKFDPESLNLLLNPNLYQALSDLLDSSGKEKAAESLTDNVSVFRRKRFTPTRVDSKITKLKTPKSEDDADVPVIRGLGGLSPVELRLLNLKDDQDDGKVIRTTTEKATTKTDKSPLHKKKGDSDVPVISGTKDPNHPSRQGKSTDDDNTVVLLNGATAQRADAPPAPPPPPSPFPSAPPLPRPLGGKARCQQRKLLLQLDEQLAVLRKLNEERDADIARTMSWVQTAGRGGPDADFLRRSAQQVPNVPIPYIPYVSSSTLPIYGHSDWVPLPLQPSYEYQVSGNSGPPVAGIYRRTWPPPPVPADAIDCDYEYYRNGPNQGGILISGPPPNSNNIQRPGATGPGFNSPSLHNPGPGGYASTPAPNILQRPGFDGRPQHNLNGYASTPFPNSFQRPGFDGRSLPNPGGYVSTDPKTGFDDRNLRHRNPGGYGVAPGSFRGDGYGRTYVPVPVAPKIEVDDKLAKPKDDPAEDEEQE